MLSVLLLASVVCVCSCPKQPAARPATLPPNWPIPQLTLPADATEYLLPWNSRGSTQDKRRYRPNMAITGGLTGEEWVVAFQTAESKEEVIAHVKGELAPLGFLVFGSQIDSPSVITRHFCTSDGLTEVSLTHSKEPRVGENPAYDGWELKILKLDHPREAWSREQCTPIR